MISYLLFCIAFLFYVGLISINTSQPGMSGEAGMGYGLALFALGVGFAISSLLFIISVAWKDGFLWVSGQSNTRFFLVGAGWACMAATTFACAAFKWEWHEGEFPQFLRWLALSNGQAWVPMLVLIPCIVLLYTGHKADFPLNYIKVPLFVGLAVSAVCTAGLVFGWLKLSAQNQTAQMESRQEDDRQLHDDYLSTIAGHKPTDPLVNILALTGRFHEEDVRLAATAKLKEHPDWEGELIRLLDNDYYFSEVYTFIDGNAVEHPNLFLAPLERSIFLLASKVKKQITESYDLQDWHFDSYGIERLLRALDEQFMNQGTDFRPAVLKLEEALNSIPPGKNKRVRFTVTPVVEIWLKKHKG